MNRFLQSFLFAYQDEHDDGSQGGGGGDAPKTYTQAEVDELIAKEVAGLKANRDALLNESKEASRRAKEAEELRQREHQDALKSAGKMDEFEKTIRSQYEPVLAEKDARYNSLAARVLGSERKAAIGAFAGDFITPEAVEILAPFVRTEFDGEDVVTKYLDANGNVVTTDPEQFRKHLREHKAFSHLLKASAASGGGASGNRGGGAAKTLSEMNDAERIAFSKSDPAEFKRQLEAQRKK